MWIHVISLNGSHSKNFDFDLIFGQYLAALLQTADLVFSSNYSAVAQIMSFSLTVCKHLYFDSCRKDGLISVN